MPYGKGKISKKEMGMYNRLGRGKGKPGHLGSSSKKRGKKKKKGKRAYKKGYM